MPPFPLNLIGGIGGLGPRSVRWGLCFTSMAESADTDEYVLLTGVRPGFKREFAFALKSHSQCSSLGPTRSRRKRGLIDSSASTNLFGVADKTDEDKLEFRCSQSIILRQKKTPKKIDSNRFPTKLKELLETGLLEDFPVRYFRGPKTRGSDDIALQGIIKGSGILCSCDICGGTQVVTPNQFELHASSGNRRPPDYIYLENGKTLRQVLNACKDATVESLEATIRNAIACSSENKSIFCLKCIGPCISFDFDISHFTWVIHLENLTASHLIDF